MLDYPSLAAVAAVVREGSFERAARALNVTPSAISQRVKQLEERLGSVLIIRGQPCKATDIGRNPFKVATAWLSAG
jgi:LysR family transcriptional regulator (chromosome initiation inhibitor)